MGYAPHVGDVVCIPLLCGTQQTADVTGLVATKVPFRCRVFAIYGEVGVIGGGTKPTDYDVTVLNGSTSLCSAMALVNTSTNKGVVTATLATTAANLVLAEGDTLDMDGDITGGTNPTVDGVHVYVWVTRE